MKTKDFLRKHDACTRGAKWALAIGDDMADVWDAMIEHGKHEWLLWTVSRPGVFSESVLRKLACRFIRETPLSDGRKVWDLLTDERSRNVVEVVEAYADGKATKEDMDAARAAARASCAAACAACAVAYAAADDAAYAAYAAARASDDAAYAAYDAAYAAYDAAYASYAAAYAAYAAARAAADDARAAADDAAYAAYAAAKAAQARMIAELGNPFK